MLTKRAFAILAALVGALAMASEASAQASQEPGRVTAYDQMIGKKFHDCVGCPEMTVVPGGAFVEGARQYNELVGKPHPAYLDEAFAVAVYDVTRRQYAQFVRETHRTGGPGCQFLDGAYWREDRRLSWDHPGFVQSDTHPVVCVSYHDATDYIAWLNSKLSPESKARLGVYRLPTGREWEFVARRGATRTYDYYGAGAVRLDAANFGQEECYPCGGAVRGHDLWRYTSPVGSFAPNAFGLYDIAGDAWQMTTECVDEGYADRKVSQAPTGSCQVFGLRGGGFNDVPGLWNWMEIRNAYHWETRNNANSFRVIRTLAVADQP
jgi:formylglycine-generating enzyme required for sulfatase activity